MIKIGWTSGFLILALISAILGFTGIAEAIANIAKITFVIFLIAGVFGIIYKLKNKKSV